MIQTNCLHKNNDIDNLTSYGIIPAKHPNNSLITGYTGKRKQWEQVFGCNHLDYQKMINIIYYFWEDVTQQSCYKLDSSNNAHSIFLTEQGIALIRKYFNIKQGNKIKVKSLAKKTNKQASELIQNEPYLTTKEITRIFVQHVNIGSALWTEVYIAQAKQAYINLYCKSELGIPRERLQDFINFLDQKRHRYYRITLMLKKEGIWFKYFDEEEFLEICHSCTHLPVRIANNSDEYYLVGVSILEFQKIQKKSIAYFKKKQEKIAFDKIMTTISSVQKQNRLKK